MPDREQPLDPPQPTRQRPVQAASTRTGPTSLSDIFDLSFAAVHRSDRAYTARRAARFPRCRSAVWEDRRRGSAPAARTFPGPALSYAAIGRSAGERAALTAIVASAARITYAAKGRTSHQ